MPTLFFSGSPMPSQFAIVSPLGTARELISRPTKSADNRNGNSSSTF